MSRATKPPASPSRSLQWALAAAMVALIGVLDYRTEPELSLVLLYLVPISQGTWFIGRRAGVALSCLSAAAWIVARYAAGSGQRVSLTFYWNALTQLALFLVVTYVVSIQLALKRALAKEQEIARTDFLTGVMNRRAFSEHLADELRRAARYGHPTSLAYVDLDNFKAVNDLHGHSAGDGALKAVAVAILGEVRATDTVARLGGDEFVLLFPETDEPAAAHIIRHVHACIDAVMRERGWPVTSSIGLVTWTRTPAPAQDVVQEAERLMYAAKAEGKDRFKGAVLR